jgi:D-alanyl-D-alanine dipeptidase
VGKDLEEMPNPLKFTCLLLALLLWAAGCREAFKSGLSEVPAGVSPSGKALESQTVQRHKATELQSLPDTAFVRLSDYSADFSYDLRYATTNNFMGEVVYDCPKCYTRVKTARALIAANLEFMEKGVRIRFFDCYRPNSVQYKMWKIVPNPQYVANPDKGSVHNRGGAVDITLETLSGTPLDMGTDFDFFGQRAYHDNRGLSDTILANRALLKETMEKYGFASVRTEWWHYNLVAAYRDPVSDFRWPCFEESQ